MPWRSNFSPMRRARSKRQTSAPSPPRSLPMRRICFAFTSNTSVDRAVSRYSNVRSDSSTAYQPISVVVENRLCYPLATLIYGLVQDHGTRGAIMPFAAALSIKAQPERALEEVCGQALGTLEGTPDLAVLFFSAHHVEAAEDLAA